jgi:hypothetical protein
MQKGRLTLGVQNKFIDIGFLAATIILSYLLFESLFCEPLNKCILYNYQALFSGILAICAAVVTAVVLWCSALLPIEQRQRETKELEQKKIRFLKLSLHHDFRLLSTRASHAASTIKVTIAANVNVSENTRKKTKLQVPAIVNQWEFMSLLSFDEFDSVMKLVRKVQDHNFDMERAGGSFGDDNFQRHVQVQANQIKDMAFMISNQMLQCCVEVN